VAGGCGWNKLADLTLWFSPPELSLTVPIVNTLAFLFTVLGEWYVEGKMISRGELHAPPLQLSVFAESPPHLDTAIGVVLSLTGIGLCVYSKT
jgi:hypothetical protein